MDIQGLRERCASLAKLRAISRQFSGRKATFQVRS
jgi:hypothetical protein